MKFKIEVQEHAHGFTAWAQLPGGEARPVHCERRADAVRVAKAGYLGAVAMALAIGGEDCAGMIGAEDVEGITFEVVPL